MYRFNVIYHYYPRFRRPIFEALALRAPAINFIYGRNSRFGIASLAESSHQIRTNFFFRNIIIQSIGLSTLLQVCRNDSVILGDLKFLNSWFYAALGRLCGRKVYFWTHGVLQRESGVKWFLRKTYYNLANGLMVYSQHEADLLRGLGYDKALHVIGNANYGQEDLAAALEDDAQENGRNGLCYIGRISVEKGLVDFARFAEAHPESRVVLVGPVAPECELFKEKYVNLIFCPAEYELANLKRITAGCNTLIMFTAAGLSLFTALLLNKRVIVKRNFPQKPEYHLLDQYGLIETFEDYDDLVMKIRKPRLSYAAFQETRAEFLRQNTAENVARRITGALNNNGPF